MKTGYLLCNDDMDRIAGLTITKLSISKDKKCISLQTDSGRVDIFAEGDCCSNSWFEHVEIGFKFGRGAQVQRVVELKMPEEKEEDGDYIKFYGWRLETLKGDISIEMRNSSNGYYGGDVRVDFIKT